MSKLWNVLLYQIAWFACVLGAVQGFLYLGPVVTLFAAALQLFFSKRPKNEGLFLLCATVLGSLWDSIAVLLGAYSFTGTVLMPWGYPLWMSALWLGFATTIRSSLSWLSRRRSTAVLLGLLGGPAAYYGGAKLGPIAIGVPMTSSLLIIGCCWAVVTPMLFVLSDRIADLDF